MGRGREREVVSRRGGGGKGVCGREREVVHVVSGRGGGGRGVCGRERGGKLEGRGGRGVCGREREVVHVSGEGGKCVGGRERW